MPATLPSDFAETLHSIEELGILHESSAHINARLDEVIRDAAVRSGQKPGDAAWNDWVPSVLIQMKQAIRHELCSPDGKGVKKQYDDLVAKGLTSEGISAIAAAIAHLINPAFVVSSVIIYLAVWLAKAGLNQWCMLPAATAVQ